MTGVTILKIVRKLIKYEVTNNISVWNHYFKTCMLELGQWLVVHFLSAYKRQMWHQKISEMSSNYLCYRHGALPDMAFFMPHLVSNSWQISCMQSLAWLQQMSLHLYYMLYAFSEHNKESLYSFGFIKYFTKMDPIVADHQRVCIHISEEERSINWKNSERYNIWDYLQNIYFFLSGTRFPLAFAVGWNSPTAP